MFVRNDSQLAGVEDVFNGILVKGDSTGDVVFYGKGAGKLPTASAVVADIIDCIKHFDAKKYLSWGSADEQYVKDYIEYKAQFYIRVIAEDKNRAIKELEAKFPISRFINICEPDNSEFAFITKEMQVSEIDDIVNSLLEKRIKVISKIRVGDF